MTASIRGKKLEPKPTNSQLIREMDKELKNMQLAARLNQMMIQQLLQNMQAMGKDLGKAYGVLNELQYKVLAMQKVGTFDADALNKQADEMRLNDFIEASDEEDKSGNFTIGETVQNDSTVIITSVAPGDNAGIFRSRIKLAESGNPTLIEGLMGKPVGTKVKCTLNEVEHEVELLGIRNPPEPVATSGYMQEVPGSFVPAVPDNGSIN